MKKTNAEYQEAYRQRMSESGLKRLMVYVHDKDKHLIKALEAKLKAKWIKT